MFSVHRSEMYFLFIFISLCIKLVKCDVADCAINRYEKYYSSAGNVYVIGEYWLNITLFLLIVVSIFFFFSISGLFDAHKGENCSISNPAVLQQMYNVAVTISLLNNLNYVPGITIGECISENLSSVFILPFFLRI